MTDDDDRPDRPPPLAPPPPVIPDSAMEGGPSSVAGASTLTPPPAVEPLDGDIPALPRAAPATDDDLRDAVGVRLSRKERRARKKRDRELEEMAEAAEAAELDADLDPAERAERRGKRRTMLVLGVSIAVGVIGVAFILLGRANADRLVFACYASEIRAEEGRGFPPWGTNAMGGPMWKPIPIPPNAECKERETESMTVLTTWYLEALVDQAERRLTGKDVTEIDQAAKQLEQALLLARHPDRRDQRRQIERLLGDVDYWRATARLRSAAESLGEAAKQFDDAATRPPAHARDASAWADIARRAAILLGAGPGGVPAPGAGSGAAPRPAPPFGVALPVEGADAAPAPVERPDAGLPTGGVLL